MSKLNFTWKLITKRETEWTNDLTGDVSVDKESWEMVRFFLREMWLPWTQSWRWKWVRKYGTLECGCLRNPLTRRMLHYQWRCPVHMAGFFEGES